MPRVLTMTDYLFRLIDAQDYRSVSIILQGKHPVLESVCFASQRIPTVCPNCAGSKSTIGLRSSLLQVSGVSSHLSFCCTSLVYGYIIHARGRFVYSQSAQQYRHSFCSNDEKIIQNSHGQVHYAYSSSYLAKVVLSVVEYSPPGARQAAAARSPHSCGSSSAPVSERHGSMHTKCHGFLSALQISV